MCGVVSQFVVARILLFRFCVCGLAESNRIMKDVHAGVCGPHMSGFMLSQKITGPQDIKAVKQRKKFTTDKKLQVSYEC